MRARSTPPDDSWATTTALTSARPHSRATLFSEPGPSTSLTMSPGVEDLHTRNRLFLASHKDGPDYGSVL